MKRILIFFTALASAVILCTCDNYEFPASPYPRVETMPVDNITSSGVTFRGKITQKGNKAIIDHGFLWGFNPDLHPTNAEKISLGEFSGHNDFERVVKFGLYKDTTYYVKSYVRTASYFVFGKVMTFHSQGSSPPVIAALSPGEGTWGDTITLSGENFSSLPEHNHVAFGAFEAEVVASTDSTISCIVPENIPDKSIPIFLTAFGNKVQSPSDFILATPTIESFSPQEGTFEDIVQITGTEFHETRENNIVRFNEHVAEVLEASSSLLKVKVPASIRTKENQITVTVNLQAATATEKFVVNAPFVSSISKITAFRGETFDIRGANFNPSKAGNVVKLGSQNATVTHASKNLLTVVIPTKGIYITRSFQVQVTVAEQSAFSPEALTLQDPWLRKADVPHGSFGRYDATAFALNGYGYVGLGSGNVGDKFWRYDPQQNNWTEIAPFPGGLRAASTSFVIGGKAYVGLGAAGSTRNDFWSYDPATGNWDRIADFPYATTNAVGLSMNGKGYVATPQETENFWEYDPLTDSWSGLGDVPATGWADAGFVIGNRLFVYVADGSTAPNTLFEYDFTLRDWNIMADSEAYDYDLTNWTTGFALNGFGYIHSQYYLHQYDPVLNTWSGELDGAPGLWALSVAFVIDGKAYLGTSYSGSYEMWEFDPAYLR